MNNFTLTNNSNATLTLKQLKGKVRLFANEEFAKAIDYPFADDGQLYNENGKCYPTLNDFVTAFSVQLTAVEETPTVDNVTVEQTVEPQMSGSFTSIAQLKAAFDSAKRSTQSDSLTLMVTLKVTYGKNRVDGTKTLLKEPLMVNGASVDSIRTKWLFCTVNGEPLYVKEFEAATYSIAS